MHASDWRKAAAMVTQQNQAAATAVTDHLNSFPLNALYQWMTAVHQ